VRTDSSVSDNLLLGIHYFAQNYNVKIIENYFYFLVKFKVLSYHSTWDLRALYCRIIITIKCK
jgi:hypothetical protein